MKVLLNCVLASLLTLTGIASACEKGEKLPMEQMNSKLYNEGFVLARTATEPHLPFTLARYERVKDGAFAVTLTDTKEVSTCVYKSESLKVPQNKYL